MSLSGRLTETTHLSKIIISLLLISLPFVGFVIGFKVGTKADNQSLYQSISDKINLREGKIKFTNPLLSCGIGGEIDTPGAEKFKNELAELVDNQKSNWAVNNISVYYRNLESGLWLGLNENAKFTPASLFKIPTAMALYKFSESDPNFLNKQLVFSSEILNKVNQRDQLIPPSQSLEEGKSYSTSELIQRMLVYSDNRASETLNQSLDKEAFLKLFPQLGLSASLAVEEEDNISAVDFAIFLRVLYNATYLWPKKSEEILKLLDESEFKDGIVAGVPAEVMVAHKFGEREYSSNNQQLHECGIFYLPSPYVLCVMTRGSDIQKQKAALKEVSGFIYSHLTPNGILE